MVRHLCILCILCVSALKLFVYSVATNMSDIAVIIHAENDKLHIGRCLERIAALSPRQVFVVDCFSTDKKCEPLLYKIYCI